jgi:hypothetical protein
VLIEPNKLVGVEGERKIRGKETGFVGMERSFRYEGGVGGEGVGHSERSCLSEEASQSCPNYSSRLLHFNAVYDDKFCFFSV